MDDIEKDICRGEKSLRQMSFFVFFKHALENGISLAL